MNKAAFRSKTLPKNRFTNRGVCMCMYVCVYTYLCMYIYIRMYIIVFIEATRRLVHTVQKKKLAKFFKFDVRMRDTFPIFVYIGKEKFIACCILVNDK